MKTTAFYITTQVLPGQKIEIQDPDFPVGETVDVFVVLPKTVASKRGSIVNMIKEIRSHRVHSSDAKKTNVIPEEDEKDPSSILEFVDQLPGQRQFKTAVEIDQYLREERDSWDS